MLIVHDLLLTKVQQLREESMKWVDIAKILGISLKMLVRRR
jgi:hypothetical protein